MAMSLGLGLGMARGQSGGATPLFGVYHYAPWTSPATNTDYNLPASQNEMTIDAVIDYSSAVSNRPVSVNTNASGGYLRVTAAGSVAFTMCTSTANAFIFRCVTPDGVITDGQIVRIRVTAKRLTTTPDTGDVHCWVDFGAGFVLQDGGSPVSPLIPFGSGLTWERAGAFATGTSRKFNIGQDSVTMGGDVGSVAVFTTEYPDTAEHDPFTSQLYVRANSTDNGFEKWSGGAWVAIP